VSDGKPFSFGGGDIPKLSSNKLGCVTGSILQVMSLANEKGSGFETAMDRQDFSKTLAEACEKTNRCMHEF
jgi:hypothetical protein